MWHESGMKRSADEPNEDDFCKALRADAPTRLWGQDKSSDSSQQSTSLPHNRWHRDCSIVCGIKAAARSSKILPAGWGIYRLNSMSLFALANHARFYKVKLSSPPQEHGQDLCLPALAVDSVLHQMWSSRGINAFGKYATDANRLSGTADDAAL